MSLVELLLVIAILGVVMMAVMSLYIPTHQSTVVQSRVADVQGNLRLAMDRITQDLLMAGFLVSGEPIVFDPAEPGDDQDFTIRTRLAGSGFGRRHPTAGPTVVGGGLRITLSQPEMAANFSTNSRVRLFNPVAMRECGPAYVETDQTAAASHVYPVTAVDAGAGTVTITTPLGLDDVPAETVLVRVRGNDQPPLQTIRYRFNDGVLERIVNGDTQLLARELTVVNFAYERNRQDYVRSVRVSLTGESQALKEGDAIAGAKTRQLQSTVTLRNVF
jgi:type II secretory pathway pseudopilin PulG